MKNELSASVTTNALKASMGKIRRKLITALFIATPWLMVFVRFLRCGGAGKLAGHVGDMHMQLLAKIINLAEASEASEALDGPV